MVRTIRETFDRHHDTYGVTVIIPSSPSLLEGFDLPALANASDWLNVEAQSSGAYNLWSIQMQDVLTHLIAADHTGQGPPTYSNATQLETTIDSMLESGVPSQKINLMLGLLGRTYKVNEALNGTEFAPGSGGDCTETAGRLACFEIPHNDPHSTSKHDDVHASSTLLQRDGSEAVQYDNDEALFHKVDMVHDKGCVLAVNGKSILEALANRLEGLVVSASTVLIKTVKLVQP